MAPRHLVEALGHITTAAGVPIGTRHATVFSHPDCNRRLRLGRRWTATVGSAGTRQTTGRSWAPRATDAGLPPVGNRTLPRRPSRIYHGPDIAWPAARPVRYVLPASIAAS